MINYNIYYAQNGSGVIDYGTPYANTSGLTFVIGPLDAPGEHLFAVRAFDSASGREEANTDAFVRLLLDASGNDVSGQPNPPHAVVVYPTAGGGCRVAWAYSPDGQGGAPAGFYVYLTPGSTPGYGTPQATVTYQAGLAGYICTLTGLADGALYTVAVRAYNAVAVEGNTSAVATVVGDSHYPDDVDSLSATVV